MYYWVWSHQMEPLTYQIGHKILKFSSQLLIFQRHLYFLMNLGGITRPTWGPRADEIPCAPTSPRFLVESWNVRERFWLQVPQEPPVNLKAPTSGYSLPLFAFSPAHRRPPWLRIWGWSSLLCAWPGEVGDLSAHLVQGWGPLHFQLAFVFVSVTPFERSFCCSKCTFIIISLLFIPSPAGINHAPAKERSVLYRDAPKLIASHNRSFWFWCLQ